MASLGAVSLALAHTEIKCTQDSTQVSTPADKRRVVGVWSQTDPGFLLGALLAVAPTVVPGERIRLLSDLSTIGELGALPLLLYLSAPNTPVSHPHMLTSHSCCT